MEYGVTMPININDFPYYRDSVLVKRFESFLSINPEAQDAWVDITAPENWIPGYHVYWTGSVWKCYDTCSGIILNLTNESLKNNYAYGYRFTFNQESPIIVSFYVGDLEETTLHNTLFSGQECIIFPTSEIVFKTPYGYSGAIGFSGETLQISKIEYRRIPYPQDFDWSQIWDVDVAGLIDYNFNGFFIKDDSLFTIVYLDNDLILYSYSNGD